LTSKSTLGHTFKMPSSLFSFAYFAVAGVALARADITVDFGSYGSYDDSPSSSTSSSTSPSSSPSPSSSSSASPSTSSSLSPSPSPSSSPSTSSSPSPGVVVVYEIEEDIEIQGAMELHFACESVTDTAPLRDAIASLIRDEKGYPEEDFPNELVRITSATCGGRDFVDRRRRLAAVSIEYDVVIPAAVAAANGIESRADVEAVQDVVNSVGDACESSSCTQDSFLELLVQELSPYITIDIDQITVEASTTQDVTSYEAVVVRTSSDGSSDVEGWAIALIVIACIAAVAIIVGAVFIVKQNGAENDEDIETAYTHQAVDSSDTQATFDATTAPHAL